jgi:hypothetical protein
MWFTAMCALLNEPPARGLLRGTGECGRDRRPFPSAQVSPALVVVTTVVAVLLVLVGLAATAARRRIGLVHVAGALLLEALLVLHAVLVSVALVGGERPEDAPTFISYLVGVLLVPVAGLLWARTERTRWAGTIIAIAGGTVAVMVWRLLQLWEATGG